jgi:hypothetical protein
MPPRYLRKGSTKLKPCSEFKVEACDIAPADQCCGAMPCTLCLELEVYGEPTTYGTATFGGSSWTGTVGGRAFVSYWERVAASYESDEPTPTSVQNSAGMSFNLIPGRSYYMETTEVTQRQYTSVMGTNPSVFGEERYDHPVENVSFLDAQRFCARLNARPAEVRAGRTYRIPLEEEWNHAGRAGATTRYYFGDDVADLGDYAWYKDSGGQSSHTEVAAKPPNAWGLYDIHGNVFEWCFADPPSSGAQRIIGGAWSTDADTCEFGTTIYADETDKENFIGFRVIMEAEPTKAVGDCEYIVTLDGEEVYRATCYEGASCRDPGGSVGVLIGYDEGTLTWTKHEPRPLAVVVDPDTGCNDFFCGTCRCTCDCLCVTITEPDGTVILGEICSTSYPCDAPVWEGSIGYYDLSIALGRDDYTGECTISLTASGEDADPVFASGCGNMSASVTLYDGTVISVACKQCSCEELQGCYGCCLPVDLAQPLYPAGVLVTIPWEVVAPSCPTINGVSGVFTPVDPTNPGIGPCGYCGTYCVIENTLIVIPGIFKVPFDPCFTSPCSLGEIKLVLECNDTSQLTGCCDRLRLWVGVSISGGTLVGDTGEKPPTCFGTVNSWVKLSPSTCTCSGGLSAEFRLSGLSILCDGVFVGGPCDGQPNCCQISCGLSDAVIVI